MKSFIVTFCIAVLIYTLVEWSIAYLQEDNNLMFKFTFSFFVTIFVTGYMVILMDNLFGIF